MKSKVGIKKRVLCIGLIFLLRVNSFAAIVSDNDGSAFITKAEFDSLKLSFQSQIDSYNNSIDSKIDGAIASYLAGLHLKYELGVIDFVNELNKATNNKFRFKNYISSVGASTNTAYITYSFIRDQYKYVNDFVAGYASSSTGGEAGLQFGIATNTTNFDSGNGNEKYICCAWKAGTKQVFRAGISEPSWNFNTAYQLSSCPSKYVISSAGINGTVSNGSGSAFVVHQDASSNKMIREYANSIYPTFAIDVKGHTYKNWYTTTLSTFKTYYCTSSGQNDTTSLTLNFGKKTSWGITNYGTEQTSTSTTNGAWGSLTLSQVKTTDGRDYTLFQYGDNSLVQKNIYYLFDTQLPTTGTSTTSLNLGSISYAEQYYPASGLATRNPSMSGVSCTYYKPYLSVNSNYLYTFLNETLTRVYGDNVYNGDGAPLVEFHTMNGDKAGKRMVKIQLKVRQQTASGGTTTSGNVELKVSNKKFNKCNLASGADSYITTTTKAVNSTGVATYEFTVEVDRKLELWYNLKSNTRNYEAYIEDMVYTEI